MSADEDFDVIYLTKKRDKAFVAWEEEKDALAASGRVKNTPRVRLARYKLDIAERVLSEMKKKVSGKTELNSPAARKEHKRRELAVEESEQIIMLLTEEIAKHVHGMTKADIQIVKTLDKKLSLEKSRLGARNNSLYKFEQRYGLNNTGLLNDSRLVNPSKHELAQSAKANQVILPDDFAFMQKPEFQEDLEKMRHGEEIKVSTEMDMDFLHNL